MRRQKSRVGRRVGHVKGNGRTQDVKTSGADAAKLSNLLPVADPIVSHVLPEGHCVGEPRTIVELPRCRVHLSPLEAAVLAIPM